MRVRVFRWLLHLWESHTPEPILRIQIQILMNLTSKAFHTPGKWLWTRPWRDRLRVYAEYTRDYCEDADPERLYALSYALGERLRRATGFTDVDDL